MTALDRDVSRPVTEGAVESQPAVSVEARMSAGMRCLLAFLALIIIYVDPSEPSRLIELTYFSLAAYCAYSMALALISFRSGWPAPERVIHWLDVFFYSCLIALTEGTSNIFFYFYFFSILSASFSFGYREGVLVVAVSVLSYLTVGILSAPPGAEFELSRTLIRPAYLSTLGYMIAYWGGYENVLKQRLRLLKDVNYVWSPRLGVYHVISSNLKRLLGVYEKSSSVLVVRRPSGRKPFLMYSASHHKREDAIVPQEVTEETARLLLILPATVSIAYRTPLQKFWLKKSACAGYVMEARARVDIPVEQCESLANLLEARSIVTVPYSQRDGTTGRLFLASDMEAFNQSDIEFLSQFAGMVSSVVENMQLMDELVAKAAEHERYRISRDLHDTTIQPYIGLKLALDALHREAGSEGPLSRRIRELAEMATMTIQDLRGYASSLKEVTSMVAEHLASAIREQAGRFKQFYGIDVEVICHMNSGLTDRVAAAAFQIVAEGLSNILRHTVAKRAYIAVLCETDFLLLQIGNERSSDAAGGDRFTPRSISERASVLGGSAFVEQTTDGFTVVRVSIPM